jgi:dihydrodipicolinate synthase/N-acetylneuraminate lyase
LSTRRRPLSIDTAAELAAHPNILGLLKVGSTAPIWELLVRTAAVKREVPVTSTFAAFTSRMKKPPADADATATLVSAASLASKPTGAAAAIAEPPPIPILKAPRTRSKTVGFQILASQTPESLAGLHAGASAIAPAFAACAPQACYEVFAAWKDSDRPLAEEKQLRLVEAARLAEATPAALKFACDLNGYFGGMPRMPYLPPTGEERAALEQLMKPLRN